MIRFGLALEKVIALDQILAIVPLLEHQVQTADLFLVTVVQLQILMFALQEVCVLLLMCARTVQLVGEDLHVKMRFVQEFQQMTPVFAVV